jgi:hypothetical protein
MAQAGWQSDEDPAGTGRARHHGAASAAITVSPQAASAGQTAASPARWKSGIRVAAPSVRLAAAYMPSGKDLSRI